MGVDGEDWSGLAADGSGMARAVDTSSVSAGAGPGLRSFTRVISRRTAAVAADKLSMPPSPATNPLALLSLWNRSVRGEGDSTDEAVISAPALAALNLLGAALSLLWLVLPHPGGAHGLAIAGATCSLCAVGTVLIAGRRRKPSWLLHTAVVVDTVLISLAFVATGDPSGADAFGYLWVALYAVCFFRPRELAMHGAWLGMAYGGSLVLLAGALTQWLLPTLTLLAAGTLLRQLMNRLRRS